MIETRLLALKEIGECPVTAFTHFLHSPTFEGFDPGSLPTQILAFANSISQSVTEFKIPRGKSLIITNVHHVLIASATNVLNQINKNVVFYWEVNGQRKTSAKTLIEMLNGDCFLIFNAKDTVKLKAVLVDASLLTTFSQGNFTLTPRIDGFLCDGNITERLKPLETVFS
jgi:hypothetical protein